jgi:hypothetical protein
MVHRMNPETLKRRYAREDDAAVDGAIDALMKHHQGRKFLWWLLEMTGVGRQPFSGNALTTAFNCGELNIGQQFFARMTSVSPDGYIQMSKEMADERNNRDAALSAALRATSDGTEFGDDTSDEPSNGAAAD